MVNCSSAKKLSQQYLTFNFFAYEYEFDFEFDFELTKGRSWIGTVFS